MGITELDAAEPGSFPEKAAHFPMPSFVLQMLENLAPPACPCPYPGRRSDASAPVALPVANASRPEVRE